MTDSEPQNPKAYTAFNDAIYTRLGGIYDFVVKRTELYDRWVLPVIVHIQGPRVLEISFGTGWLLTRYAALFETYGVDLNRKMIRITAGNLKSAGLAIPLQQAEVEALPYRDQSFDTVVNTMAYSGYPRADDAMSEIHRVLKPGGRLVMVDIGLPKDRNWVGRAWIHVFIAARDILRDMGQIFRQHGFTYSDEAIGLSGALHLYVANRK